MENKSKFQALNFNVIVEATVLKFVADWGYDFRGYISATESQQAGVLVSIGEGCPKDGEGNHFISEGQTVVFSKHRVTQMTIDTKPYLVIPYSDIVLRM